MKIFIWNMLGGRLKNGVGQGFILHAIIPANYNFC